MAFTHMIHTFTHPAQVIVERMMSYLRSTTDEHIKKDIVRKVGRA